MRSILSYTKQNQSRILDSLWAKVKIFFIIYKDFYFYFFFFVQVVEMEGDLLENGQIKNRGEGFQSHNSQLEITNLESKLKSLEAELKAKSVIEEKRIPETKEILRQSIILMKNYQSCKLLFRDIRKITSQLSDLEKKSTVIEADFLNYKTLFEESNITVEKISEKLDSKISELTDLLEEFDIKGKNVIQQPHTVF